VKLPSWRHKDRAAAGAVDAEPVSVEPQAIRIDIGQLREVSAVFAAPRWLRDIGIASWLLVGLALLLVGLIALLALTSVIVEPVMIGLVLATVSTPVVSWLQRKGVPRLGGAFLVLLGFLALGVLILVMVLGGIVAQGDEIKSSASAGADKAQSWLEDVGVDSSGASSANQNVSEGTSTTISTFVKGLGAAVQGVTALIFFVVFSIFSLFFLLKDGPSFRRFVDGHMGVPLNVAQTITGNVISSLRRYFAGVTIVAAFNAVVVGVGALILDVPLAGTIAVVTFVTAYIPFIGAFVSGAFAVVLALGSEGTQTALIMLVIVLLANGLLQNVVQPIAFGATLRMNPLLVLVTTIGFGALFGMFGLVLGAPLTSAAIHISGDLARARAAAGAANPEAERDTEPSSDPGDPDLPGAPG
jgi:putative heme transporter